MDSKRRVLESLINRSDATVEEVANEIKLSARSVRRYIELLIDEGAIFRRVIVDTGRLGLTQYCWFVRTLNEPFLEWLRTSSGVAWAIRCEGEYQAAFSILSEGPANAERLASVGLALLPEHRADFCIMASLEDYIPDGQKRSIGYEMVGGKGTLSEEESLILSYAAAGVGLRVSRLSGFTGVPRETIRRRISGLKMRRILLSEELIASPVHLHFPQYHLLGSYSMAAVSHGHASRSLQSADSRSLEFGARGAGD